MEQAGQLAAIAFVFIALAAVLWVGKQRGLVHFGAVRTSGVRRMKVVERLPLTAQHALHLVQVEDKLLIVASAPGGCSVLGPVSNFTESPKAQSGVSA